MDKMLLDGRDLPDQRGFKRSPMQTRQAMSVGGWEYRNEGEMERIEEESKRKGVREGGGKGRCTLKFKKSRLCYTLRGL